MYVSKRKGVTLIETIVTIALVAVLASVAVVSVSAVQKNRTKGYAETLMYEFSLARDFAKTHGGDATIYIEKTESGIKITRSSVSVKEETKLIEGSDVSLSYKVTNDSNEYVLGESWSRIEMTFAQTTGAIIGPHFIDYIVIGNSVKSYKLIIEQKTGTMFYDYDVTTEILNTLPDTNETVACPCFYTETGNTTSMVSIQQGALSSNGTRKSVQPELVYDSNYIRISGVYRATEIGTYEIAFTLKDPYFTAWEDGAVGTKYLYWEIVP